MSSISKRTLGFSVAAAMAVLFAAAAPVRAGSIPVYASGHCDLCADYNSTEGILELHYHFHTGSPGLDEDGNPLEGEIEPSALYTRVSDATKGEVPYGSSWEFLGAPAGSDVWVLPQSSTGGVPFLGFGTDELNDEDWSTGITYTLLGVSGPGQFSMWTTNPYGIPTVYWATSDGIDGSDIYTLGIPGHSHANWGFTAEGVYGVQMQISGTLADGTTVVYSDVETFTFLVGSSTVPEPGTLALLIAGGVALAFGWLRRRRKRTIRFSLLAATAALFVAAVSPVHADSLPVFASGAIHLGLKYERDELLLQYHIPYEVTAEDGVTTLLGRYDSDALYTRVPDASKTTLQAAQLSFFEFDVWILPQVQDSAMPFLGFGSGLTASDWQSTDVTLKLFGFSGPGQFALWATDGFGNLTAYWTTSNGLDGSDVYGLPVDGGHTHANWGFTEEGVYGLTVEASCTLLGGGVKTDTETFTFLVGSSTAVPEPGALALLATGAAVTLMGLRRRHRRQNG